MSYGVVIAEDETLILRNTVKKVESADLGFSVVGTAQTGTQALELIDRFNPYLLITDIRMPVMDGISLIEQAKIRHPDLDVIILSGYSDFSYARSAVHLGVVEYLLKPVDEEQLNEVLRSLRCKYHSHSISDGSRPTQAPVEDLTVSELAAMMRNYINQEFRNDIDLASFAEKINYSLSYLTKVFTQNYDTAPNRYLITLRIREARRLLEAPEDYSVRRVGEMVGYPDQGYFSRIFKKYVGISPQQYKKDRK